MIGNNFKPEILERPAKCSECGKRLLKFGLMLVSRKGGKVMKRVCSDQCRLDFDDRYWQEKADERQVN